VAHDVGVAREGVQHQDRVAGRLVETAPGLERDPDPGQGPAAVQREVADGDGPPAGGHGGVGHQAPLAAAKPASRSATMSSMCSMPTARRTSPGVTPAARWASSESWEWVVEAGWM